MTYEYEMQQHKKVSEGEVWCCGEYATCEYLIDVLSIANLNLGLRWLHDRAFWTGLHHDNDCCYVCGKAI